MRTAARPNHGTRQAAHEKSVAQLRHLIGALPRPTGWAAADFQCAIAAAVSSSRAARISVGAA